MITEFRMQGGAAIFKATEGWTYGVAIYFCQQLHFLEGFLANSV